MTEMHGDEINDRAELLLRVIDTLVWASRAKD